jgi:beta-glucosidase
MKRSLRNLLRHTKLVICFGVVVIAGGASAQAVDDSAGREHFVRDLLAKMTLQEKLGQVSQFAGGRSINPNSKIDDTQRQLVREGKVGSYLHVAGAEFLHGLQHLAVEESRLGVPLLFALDVVHGFKTIYPVPLAAASSWDPDAVERAAHMAAIEASAASVHWTFAPMVDIALDPRWGRIVEGAGEDPYLGAVMAAAQVRGYQGDDLAAPDTILACPKHFVAYGAAIGGRDYNSADVSERVLRELYLPPFLAAVEAGAATMMTSFNDIAGIPMTANPELVSGLLRGEWGWNGLIVSDWNAVAELLNHGTASTPAQAAAAALTSGVDMEMVSGLMQSELGEPLESGMVPMAALDAAVARVLGAKYDLGLFEDPYRYGDAKREQTQTLSEAHHAVARELAEKSIVLLKNAGDTLPLSPSVTRIAVLGPLADDSRAPLGSWKAFGMPEHVVTVLDGIRAAVSAGTTVEYAAGTTVKGNEVSGIDAAVALAKSSDVAVVVIGEDDSLSGEARSRSTIEIPGAQRELTERVLATGTRTVIVLMNGRPLALEWLDEAAPVILETWLLGVQMGHAVADVLFGNVSPGGKLVATFPRRTGQIPIFYRHLNTGRPQDEDLSKDTTRYIDLPITPLYPFGHGLSYTTFEYGDLRIGVGKKSFTTTFSLRNTGKRAADEIPQLYIRDAVASVARPVQELKAFDRIPLEPGAAVTVTFEVPLSQLAFPGPDLRTRIEPGEFQVMIGRSSADVRLRGTFELEAEPESHSPGELSTLDFENGRVHPAPAIVPARYPFSIATVEVKD